MRFLIIYFLDQVLFFGTVLGHFSQCNFKIFHRCPTMVTDIFTQPTLHPPSSTWLCSNSIENNCNSRIISYPLNSLLLWSVLFQLWGSHSFLQGWKLPFSEGAPTPSPHLLSVYPALSEANLKSYTFFLRAIQIGACKMYEAL